MVKKELYSVKIDFLNFVSTSEERLLSFLASRLLFGKKIFVVTPNPEFLIFANHHLWFRKIIESADIAIPDGIGFIWAGKILGRPIKERISGTDLMASLSQLAAKKGWKIYLIGGEKGVAKKTLSVLKKRYPELQGWAEKGPELELKNGQWTSASKQKVSKAVQAINAKKPDLLFVAFGMGKQEKFIADNWSKLEVKLAMGVGGAFDYLSGTVPRAPGWMRKVGLEWLYRLFRQPWRWQRQWRLIEFGWLILQEKLF